MFIFVYMYSYCLWHGMCSLYWFDIYFIFNSRIVFNSHMLNWLVRSEVKFISALVNDSRTAWDLCKQEIVQGLDSTAKKHDVFKLSYYARAIMIMTLRHRNTTHVTNQLWWKFTGGIPRYRYEFRQVYTLYFSKDVIVIQCLNHTVG